MHMFLQGHFTHSAGPCTWLQGKARMLILSPYFSARAFIAVKSLTVVPHREATFSTSVGLPRKDLKSTAEPSILFAEKSLRFADMLTAARDALRADMPPLKAETLPSTERVRNIFISLEARFDLAVPRARLTFR